MLKYKILGGITVLTGLLYCYLLVLGFGTVPSFPSPISFWSQYLYISIILTGASLCAGLIYKLLFKKVKAHFKVYLTLTLAPLFWIVLMFLGFMTAASSYFPLIIIAFLATAYLLVYKDSIKIAVLLTVVTLFVSGYVFVSAFEEDYCLDKGDQAKAAYKSEMINATADDAAVLKEFDIKPGQPIGTSFRTHMLCHQTFNLNQALQEAYLFKN